MIVLNYIARGDIFNGGGTSRRRSWGGDLLLGHGEDELALGTMRHGRLDDVADAGRTVRGSTAASSTTDNTSGDVGSPLLCWRAAFIVPQR